VNDSPPYKYVKADDLWIVTCYFNPQNYKSRRSNYEKSIEIIKRSGLNIITVECAFGNTPHMLASSEDIIKVRSNSIMWQKERLLNIGFSHVPQNIKKIAWIDCDILFTNPEWAIQTSELLEHYQVVQLFERIVRLKKDNLQYTEKEEIWTGFAATAKLFPELMFVGNFLHHGHTGFAWAAQRNILDKHGLYDACISGSADHMMAHVMYGDFKGPCIDRFLNMPDQTLVQKIQTFYQKLIKPVPNHFRTHFEDWASAFYNDIKGQVSFVDGFILHLWHGNLNNRLYLNRHNKLRRLNFNPTQDLKLKKNKTWEWNPHTKHLNNWAMEYFKQRHEDD